MDDRDIDKEFCKSANLLSARWRKEMLRQLEEPLWLYSIYKPETLPWWKKAWRRAHWNTIGRFRSWLHRDCGDY